MHIHNMHNIHIQLTADLNFINLQSEFKQSVSNYTLRQLHMSITALKRKLISQLQDTVTKV